MKTTLKAQMSQQIAMTPQLLQSIRLLQLDSLRLEQEVRRMLERNPLLEQEEDEEDVVAEDANPRAVIDEDEPDYAWERGAHAGGGGEDEDAMARVADRPHGDFRAALLEQFALECRAPSELALAALVLDHTDDNGYLEVPVAELAALARAQGLDADALETVRQRVMRLEPAGCGAADLSECLRAQLDGRDDVDPLAHAIVRSHLALLAAHDLPALAVALGVDRDRAAAAVDRVLALDPRPASGWGAAEDAVVVPDVVVRKQDGQWRVSLNPRTAPRLRVNAALERLMGEANGPGEHAVMRELLQEARWMARGVAIRNDTLLRATTAIVERQHGFLERGEEAMVPLTLKEIADAIGVHESTISRVSTGKYVQTPRGTFELKHFFTVRLNGAEVGGSAVRAMVRKLIDQENPAAPLGDDAIATLLARQGIRIARRTVAKYRDQLRIPPAKVRALTGNGRGHARSA